MKRNRFLIAFSVGIFLFSMTQDILGQEREIRFAITAAVGSDPDFTNYGELARYITNKIGASPILITSLTYDQVDALFLKGKVDIGFLCNTHYVRRNKEVGFELLAAPIVVDYQKPSFQIYIIVPKDSQFTSLDDLRGKIVDFSDPLSTTTVYGAYLLAPKKQTIKSYFKKAIYSGSHDMTIELVANRIVDGGFIDGHIWDYHDKMRPQYSGQTKIIHRSPDFTIPPVVVSHSLDEATKKGVKEILLTMHQDSKAKGLLEKLRIQKFVDIKDTDYQGLYQMYEQVKGQLQIEESR